MSNQIAQTILQQLGGNKFLVMTGAKKLTAYDNALGFKIGRNKAKCNWVKIVLTSMDDYNMEFYRFDVRTGLTKLHTYEGVYFDMLQELFTEYTGMYTRLF
jgi:hypothetical protein